MKIRVAVLFGGESVEHEVSIISASQAMNALNPEKYEVVPVYISKDRDFYSGPELRNVQTFTDMNTLKKNVPLVHLVKKDGKVVVEPLKKSFFKKTEEVVIDLAIPVMHGTNGEDGSIQGLLEMLKLPYAGCDVIAAGCGQDKSVMKHMLENSGLPLCPWTWIYGCDYDENKAEIKAKVAELGYPVVLKPACLGSSVGIVIAHNEDELDAAVEEAGQYDEKIVIEQMVQNLREINCSVLGDHFECRPSVLEEVTKGAEILDFKDKYLGSGKTKGAKSQGMASASRIVPAPISEEMTEEIQSLAVKTFKVLGSSGVCRIDFMINDAIGQVYVNEINTIPGSLAFYLWKEAGMSFTELMDALVKQAIDRQRRREKRITSFDSNILSNFSASSAKGVKGVKGVK